MQIIRDKTELQQLCSAFRQAGRTIGFVPTMGALHAGHASLVQRARAENEVVVVSIFVNPAQFGPKEDLAKYPRTFEADCALLEAAGADDVFFPELAEVYPAGFSTYVEVRELSAVLEGAIRPGHFVGMATVVLKLFHLVQPTRAYFGQKDFQQCMVVRQMVRDLDLAVEVVVCPTVREQDGLAMSSRNRYLGQAERPKAAMLYQALQKGQEVFTRRRDGAASGGKAVTSAAIVSAVGQQIKKVPELEVEYVEVRSAGGFDGFREVKEVHAGDVILVAARLGHTRLIDNLILE